ncbi:MAG: hypothetical protein M1812_007121 [Candelaria pacifica]|nr:MAG: hypothetical protein M1812_007121 [Candelaria pacifica]
MSQRPAIPERTTSSNDPVLRTKPSVVSRRSETSNESLTISLKELEKKDAQAKKSIASLNSPNNRLDWFRLLEERVHNQIERQSILFARSELKLAAGELNPSEFADRENAYLDEIANLQAQISDILGRTIRISDDEPSDDNAVFVKLLESQVFPPKGKRQNTNFKEILMEAYKAINPEHSEQCWCPISKKFSAKTNRKATYIFPYKLGQEAMDTIFGPAPSDAYTLTGAKNGMLLDFQISEQFDFFNLVIVPKHPEGRGRWILRVLHRALMRQTVGAKDDQVTFRDIDGQELEFTNHHRPAARFLYLHYILALLRTVQPDRSANQEAVIKELCKDMPVWTSPGRYLKQNMLLAVAAKAGQDITRFHNIYDHSLGEKDDTNPQISMNVLGEMLEDEELYDVIE